MLLSHDEINELLDMGIVEGAKQEHINATSLDIVLGKEILVEKEIEEEFSPPLPAGMHWSVSLADRDALEMHRLALSETGYALRPGEFILAQSAEVFHLPLNISCEYKLKSSMARIGLNHLNAGWCDAGWHDSVLTLELVNVTQHHAIVLRAGDRIGQVVFFRHSPVLRSQGYGMRGRYNSDRSVEGVKP